LLRETPRRAIAAAFAALLVSGCHPYIHPKEPSIPVVQPPSPPPSLIQVPVTVPLERLRQVAEAAVPSVLHTDPWLHLIDGGPDAPACGYGVGYQVDRAPLSLTGKGNQLNTGLFVSYWLQGRKRAPCRGPLVYGSCGTNGEPPRRLVAGFTTTLGIKADWNADVRTVAKPVQPLDQCNLTFFNIDVTPKIVGFFGSRIQEMVNRLNENASSQLALADRVRTAWSAMQKPIFVGSLPTGGVIAATGTRDEQGIWLVIDPQTAGYFPIRATNSDITAGAQLNARPRLVIGQKPDPTSTSLPAEALQVPAGNTFFIVLPIEVGYAAINQALRQALNLDNGGTSFPPTGSKRITVVDAEVFAYGAKAVLRLDFRGSAFGRVYFTATPTFNSYVNTLTFPDLEYTLESSGALERIADWFKHEEFRDYLRGRLSFDLSGPVTAAQKQLTDALNTDTPDVRLRGAVLGFTPLAVFADPKHGQFQAVIQANGTLSIDVK
jgi:hypothetical protein